MNDKVDMHYTCGLAYNDKWVQANEDMTLDYNEWMKWYNEHCGKCIHMSEICMYGEEYRRDVELVSILRDVDNCDVLDYLDEAADRIEQLSARAENGESAIETNKQLVRKYQELEKKYNRLKQEIDDVSMDHVCDYLEWYFNECERLREENEKLQAENAKISL